MNKRVKFELIETIDYRPVFDRTVVKASSGAIKTDHITALQHITAASDQSVWFWQQGASFTGDLCTDIEFTRKKVNAHNIKTYDPIFRCQNGDVYDIYWSTGKMATIKILETTTEMNFAEFSIKVILPTLHRMTIA